MMKQSTNSKLNKQEAYGLEVAQEQYCTFHNSMIERFASDVYDNALKITAIKAFHDCIEAMRNNDVVRRLLVAFSEDKISYETLYDEYLSIDCGFAAIESFSETIEFFNYVLENINKRR